MEENKFTKIIKKDLWILAYKLILLIQIFFCYIGWSITKATIIESSLNTIGLVIIIFGVCLKPGIDFIKYLKYIKNL